MIAFDIAREANRRIFDFVQQPASERLRPGTGYYSTPFRGALFGLDKSSQVASRLTSERVDVLWLGSHPNVPDSLKQILRPESGQSDFWSFQMQMESGFFGSRRWARDGAAEPDWDPLATPKGGWHSYHQLLTAISRIDHVAMANYFPWGAKELRIFARELAVADRPLLRRAFEFAEDLMGSIVEALDPRLLIVPLSVAGNSDVQKVNRSGLSLDRAADVVRHSAGLDRGNFDFYSGACRLGSRTIRALFVPGAGSLFLTREDKKRMVDAVARVVDGG